MIKAQRILGIILLAVILTFQIPHVIYVYPQGDALEEEIEIRMDTFGGNINTAIIIRGDALQSMDVLKGYIPKSYFNETTDSIYVEGSNAEGEEVPLDFILTSNEENYIIEISLVPGVNSILISIFQPEEIKPEGGGRYTANVLSYLHLNAFVRVSDVLIRPPLDVSAVTEELPVGYSQIRVSPEGVIPSQFEISRLVSETTIRILNRSLVEEIPLTREPASKTSLILADTWVNMVLYPSFEGKILGEMNITLKNNDLITWSKDTEIQFIDLYKITEVQTELGIPVEYDFTGRVYKIMLPYDLRPGDKITFNIKFYIEDNVTFTESLFPQLNVDIDLPPPTDIPVEKFIVIQNWDNMRFEINYYTKNSEAIKIKGILNLDIQSLLTQTGLSYILFMIFTIVVGFLIYKGANKILQEELPTEARKYLESFVKEMELMAQVIDLERRHLEGLIKDREYVKEKTRIQRSIKTLKRSLSKSRGIIDKLAEENKLLKEILEEIKEIEKAYEEINKLEDSRRRRAITLDQYKDMRRELITKFEIYAAKIRKRI